ncbi:protein of unknown function [Maridesulfovibrio hydrothermalis AM13 = DSM 14728]|uniref:Uncharacterized protein n=1 Tax=Maridesulfovibrio hydrothermalis AM13 = DSM 14728 TaxID=1121451 RepID=L0RC44_9BACT|nr:protein of unknown function [Maridesulfovibrio hydrothermalis AM13 = DSM 14728]
MINCNDSYSQPYASTEGASKVDNNLNDMLSESEPDLSLVKN